jgi:hypothetical protein
MNSAGQYHPPVNYPWGFYRGPVSSPERPLGETATSSLGRCAIAVHTQELLCSTLIFQVEESGRLAYVETLRT